MKLNIRLIVLLSIILICFISSQANMAPKDEKSDLNYPIICNTELGSAPKNVPLKEVDINSDGITDLIATYPSGVCELYINYKNGKYYRVIRSNVGLSISSEKKNRFTPIYISSYGIVDGQLYKCKFIPFEYEKNGEIVEFDVALEHDGVSYKPPFVYCKRLGIYAPCYRFDSSVKVVGKSKTQKIKTLYCELRQNKIYQVIVDKQESYGVMGVNFADINQDSTLDAFVYYGDKQGSGASTYAALLLNDGSNNFFFSGIIDLGFCWENFPSFQSQTITISGVRYTGIVFNGPMLRPGEKKLNPKSAVELYLYQPELKEFMCVTALPGRDKSTFIPLNKKEFEDIVNPPLFRNAPVNPGNSTKTEKIDEPAISKLIDNYEKSLVNAVNSNKFSMVEKYLATGSNLYNSQKSLVAKLYQKKTQEKLVGYKVEKIKPTDRANVYQVYVSEKIGIKRADKADFAVSEFHWMYTAIFAGGKYSLSDIARWDGK